jgi:hypothetical protein
MTGALPESVGLSLQARVPPRAARVRMRTKARAGRFLIYDSF